MSIKVGDNFQYRGKKPLDSRDSFDTIEAMVAYAESSIDDGHIAYNKETDKHYKFNSSNEVDVTLGKWREFKSGSDSNVIDDTTESADTTYSSEKMNEEFVKQLYTGDGTADKYLGTDGDGRVVLKDATGGNEKFTREDTTTTAIGGLNAGSSIKDLTANQVLEAILFPYQKPTVAFTINPATTIYEVGSTVSSIDFSITVSKKSKDVQSIKIYDGSNLVTTITDGVSAGGVFTYTYACNVTANTTLKVEVTDGDSVVSATKNLVFTYKSYYGYVADGTTVDETAITGLQNDTLKTSKGLTYNGISCSNSKVVYAYPKSQGLLSSILDGNGFEYIDSYTNTTINVGGIDYYVYVLTDAATLDGFKQVFA